MENRKTSYALYNDVFCRACGGKLSARFGVSDTEFNFRTGRPVETLYLDCGNQYCDSELGHLKMRKTSQAQCAGDEVEWRPDDFSERWERGEDNLSVLSQVVER